MDPQLRRWMPAIAAAAVFVVVIGASAFGGGGGDGVQLAPTQPSGDPGSPSSATAQTAPVSPAVTVPIPSVAQKVALTRSLTEGVQGDDVKMVQQRLKDLRFDPGEIDGIYGGMTIRAIWAFQKLVLGIPRDELSRNGKLTPEQWDTMQSQLTIAPRRTNSTATHVEVYLPQQTMAVFNNNQPVLVTHVSSGSMEEWCSVVTIDPGESGNDTDAPIEQGICGFSETPSGVYKFTRRHVEGDGWREGKLGRMYKPVYFNYGIAVHGSLDVPNRPASHGCIRIPMHIAEYFPDLVAKGDQIFVFDDVKDPEEYDSPPQTWDWPDPSWVPPTTVATTVPTTVAPVTTKATTTTTKAPVTTKATTTTTKAPATTKAPIPTTVPPTTAAATQPPAGP